uniref:MADF domain-containing protein n=1 Tax=Acrobeloides nanus TaxID=290746 RepID=A0A914CPY0_9BILA
MAERPPTFNELLIQEVQRHPELYDQHHRVCTDNEERNMIWDAIASRIDGNVTGEFAKKRWLQMRDRYRKELKTALRSLTPPKWPYFEKLSWLDPYLKDTRNGSTPLNSFNVTDGNNSSNDTNFAFRDDFLDFGFGSGISTNALLENIMAVSSKVFDQRKENLNAEFSPDSAIASTSDDGEPQSHSNDARSPNLDDTGSDCGFGSAFNRSVKSDNSEQNEMNDMPGTSKVSITEGSLIDHKMLSSQLFEMANASVNEEGASGSNPFNSRLLHSRSRIRSHNPPYLVRRGGGIKVKPIQKIDEMSLSICKIPANVTEKPIATVQAYADSNTPHKESSGNILGDEWQTREWANDEDMLFARLIVIRLRKFNGRDKRVHYENLEHPIFHVCL